MNGLFDEPASAQMARDAIKLVDALYSNTHPTTVTPAHTSHSSG